MFLFPGDSPVIDLSIMTHVLTNGEKAFLIQVWKPRDMNQLFQDQRFAIPACAGGQTPLNCFKVLGRMLWMGSAPPGEWRNN